MKVSVAAGKYVLAVSGGVDSMVLLDLLSKLPEVELIVAHFDHGIRPDSPQDERFVKRTAKRHGLVFESDRGKLGEAAGEAAARAARYAFLEKTRLKHKAEAIITAHHQDDLIETALINLLRGTGRRGLLAMSSNQEIIRPLLGYTKQEIQDYARKNGVGWREDPTNAQDDYLRNRLRHQLITQLSPSRRRAIIDNLDAVAKLDAEIEDRLAAIERLVMDGDTVDRSRFAGLPAEVGGELLVRRFRQLGVPDIDRPTISRINAGIRTSKPGRRHPVKAGLSIELTTETASFSG